MDKTHTKHDISTPSGLSYTYPHSKQSLNIWKRFKNAGTHLLFRTTTITSKMLQASSNNINLRSVFHVLDLCQQSDHPAHSSTDHLTSPPVASFQSLKCSLILDVSVKRHIDYYNWNIDLKCYIGLHLAMLQKHRHFK